LTLVFLAWMLSWRLLYIDINLEDMLGVTLHNDTEINMLTFVADILM